MSAFKKQLVSSLFSIDYVGENVYESNSPHIGGVIGPNRLFGGYIAAQTYFAVRDALRKNHDERVIFSMHYNFVSAGDPNKNIYLKLNQHDNIYSIEIAHDHKNIGLAHVKLDTNFLDRPENEKNVRFPHMTNLPTMGTLLDSLPSEKWRTHYHNLFNKLMFEVRPQFLIQNYSLDNHKVAFYARIYPECLSLLDEDSGIIAVIALSDFFVIQSAQNLARQHGWKTSTAASLHHKIHFHTDYVQADQWFYVETKTETSTGNKAKIFGHLYDSNKKCVMSFIQESYCVAHLPEAKL
ncbi:unnamed protein product [Caenorhabditis angaria]|uniref:Acyl-CoA thioesterase-like C-terminal domain-containing protein n=1 Tax=Caenorhabditis angaria TaxID=860376 RepID=A0A9P1NAR4_9PELO|nr:unnamed protein product [Caenorhabditis angaria]